MVCALRLHAFMHKIGLESHASLGNDLVLMLVDINFIHLAQHVFDLLLRPNKISWNSLITGCLRHENLQHSFVLHQRMEESSLLTCPHTYIALLKACGKLKDLGRGCQIHAEIASKGELDRDLYVGSCLVDMYAKCGSLAKAKDAFSKLPFRNVVVWTALMAGYVEGGHGVQALQSFEQMQCEGIPPDTITFVCCLKACGIMQDLEKGQDFHFQIIKTGYETDLLVGSAIIEMYAKCGFLEKAQEVFDKLVAQTVVAWNTLITAYVEDGCSEEALECLSKMQGKNVSPDDVTFVCSLKASASLGDKMRSLELHIEIVKQGLEGYLFVGNTLVDVYGKCGALGETQAVFDRLQHRTTVSWNALVGGYVEHMCCELAMECLNQMQDDGICPNDVTFILMLKACGIMGAEDRCEELHMEIARMGLQTDLVVCSTLVDTYAKLGSLAIAEEVFEGLANRNAVSWNALLAGYAECEQSEMALHCFECMQREGICPHIASFVCSLKVCGSLGATRQGQEMHSMIVKRGLEEDLFIGNTLVVMYGKCGTLKEAQAVYGNLLIQDEVSCNALMTGYAQLGEGEHVYRMFERMIPEGVKPNLVLCLNVLNACCHAGLLDQGWLFFELLCKDVGIIPGLEHYTCIVDLLGRAGHIEMAIGVIRRMPLHPSTVVWHTVLGACRKWGNPKLGRHAFERAIQLDEQDAAAYICMFNMYMAANMPEEASIVETMRVQNQAWLKNGCDDFFLKWAPAFEWD